MTIRDALGSLASRVRDAARRRHAHHDIRRLDAHLLRDIGVFPCTVPDVAATLGTRPDGRVPRDCIV